MYNLAHCREFHVRLLDRYPIILIRHSRESGNPGASDLTVALDPRFRGGDEGRRKLMDDAINGESALYQRRIGPQST
jgi:hypothetical protein